MVHIQDNHDLLDQALAASVMVNSYSPIAIATSVPTNTNALLAKVSDTSTTNLNFNQTNYYLANPMLMLAQLLINSYLKLYQLLSDEQKTVSELLINNLDVAYQNMYSSCQTSNFAYNQEVSSASTSLGGAWAKGGFDIMAGVFGLAEARNDRASPEEIEIGKQQRDLSNEKMLESQLAKQNKDLVAGKTPQEIQALKDNSNIANPGNPLTFDAANTTQQVQVEQQRANVAKDASDARIIENQQIRENNFAAKDKSHFTSEEQKILNNFTPPREHGVGVVSGKPGVKDFAKDKDILISKKNGKVWGISADRKSVKEINELSLNPARKITSQDIQDIKYKLNTNSDTLVGNYVMRPSDTDKIDVVLKHLDRVQAEPQYVQQRDEAALNLVKAEYKKDPLYNDDGVLLHLAENQQPQVADDEGFYDAIDNADEMFTTEMFDQNKFTTYDAQNNIGYMLYKNGNNYEILKFEKLNNSNDFEVSTCMNLLGKKGTDDNTYAYRLNNGLIGEDDGFSNNIILDNVNLYHKGQLNNNQPVEHVGATGLLNQIKANKQAAVSKHYSAYDEQDKYNKLQVANAQLETIKAKNLGREDELSTMTDKLKQITYERKGKVGLYKMLYMTSQGIGSVTKGTTDATAEQVKARANYESQLARLMLDLANSNSQALQQAQSGVGKNSDDLLNSLTQAIAAAANVSNSASSTR